jgi:hypothetical protein
MVLDIHGARRTGFLNRLTMENRFDPGTFTSSDNFRQLQLGRCTASGRLSHSPLSLRC